MALVILETGAGRVAENLGYPGQTLRVIAVPDGDDGGGLVRAISGLAAKEGLSIAYSQSYGAGLVTVLDEEGRFQGADGPLADGLAPVGSGPTALVSSASVSGANLEPALEAGVTVVGTFTSDVMFEQQYPVVLVNVDAGPFAEGVYLFAGEGLDDGERDVVAEVARVFDANGLSVVDAVLEGVSTPAALAADTLRSPYGVVVLLFGAIVVLTQLVVLVIRAALSRDRWLAAAVLGATRNGVRLLVWWRLMSHVVVGLAAGSAVALVLALGVGDLSMVDTGTRLMTVPGAFLLGLAVSAASSWTAGVREGRWVARAVPC